jgi:hypothetical protein
VPLAIAPRIIEQGTCGLGVLGVGAIEKTQQRTQVPHAALTFTVGNGLYIMGCRKGERWSVVG